MKKVVVVTGVSRGIGRALVSEFLSDGFLVLGISRRGVEHLANADLVIRHSSYKHVMFNGDSFQDLVKTISFEIGDAKISILINNAGSLIKKEAMSLLKEDLESSFNVNAVQPFLLVQAMLGAKLFVEKAHVVNIGSVGGVLGSAKYPGMLAYSASKAALMVITECMQEEWGDQLTVNALALGAVETEMFRSAFSEARTPISDVDMASWIADFAVNSVNIMAGQVVQVKKGDPER